MEVPRLGFKSEVQLLSYITVTAMQDPSCVCDLHHSSQQHWILNLLSEARDQTHNLMVTSWIRVCCTMTGTPPQGTFDCKIAPLNSQATSILPLQVGFWLVGGFLRPA